MRPRRAFTLIELLVVVAIIAILAAIAVPNFLAAQTRAKVGRAKADMRALATALEAYRVDANRYPPAFYTILALEDRWKHVTTPVAYIDEIGRDPYSPDEAPFRYEAKDDGWKVWSVGPDGKDDQGKVAYDSTNGAASAGDVIRAKD